MIGGFEVGTIAQQISALSSVGFLIVLLRFYIMNRRLRIDATRVKIAAKEVDDKDIADIRDHYADEVRQLRDQLQRQSERHFNERQSDLQRFREDLTLAETRHRETLLVADRAHQECVDVREKLNEQVTKLKSQVEGLIRMIVTNQARGALLIDPDEMPQEIREAAERVEDIFRSTKD